MTGLIGHRCKHRKVFSRVVLIYRLFSDVSTPFIGQIDTDFRYLELTLYVYAPPHRRVNHRMIEFCGGDHSGVVPPVPISNTEVKYTKADGSVMNARVGSRHLRTQYKKRTDL